MKVVLTGGPSAGKTALVQTIQKEFGTKVATVPEAAAMLFQGGFPRGRTPTQVAHQQRAIYFVQRELEEMITEAHPGKLIVCDRGSLDGLAYWQLKPTLFFKTLGTNVKRELARYDWVIHLESAGAGYDSKNPIRIESPDEARAIDKKIQEAWKAHPRRVVIPNSQLFSSKMAVALSVIEEILSGKLSKKDIKNIKGVQVRAEEHHKCRR